MITLPSSRSSKKARTDTLSSNGSGEPGVAHSPSIGWSSNVGVATTRPYTKGAAKPATAVEALEPGARAYLRVWDHPVDRRQRRR
jgi:hypothetical protein